jgi:hypothetical protein
MDYRGLLGLDPRISGREQPSFYRDVEGEFADMQQGLLGMLPMGGMTRMFGHPSTMSTMLKGRSTAEKELKRRWADKARRESDQLNKDRAGFTQGNRIPKTEKGKKLKKQRVMEELRKESRYGGLQGKELQLDDLRKSTAGKSLLTRLQKKNDLLFREDLRRQGHLGPANPEEAIQLQKLIDEMNTLPIHNFQGGPTFRRDTLFKQGLLGQ